MNYGFYLFACLGITIFQTAVILEFFPSHQCYDLFIPYILYLGVMRPFYEVLPFVIASGLIVDGLSAGPLGLYATSYLWIFVLTRLASGVFVVAHWLCLPLAISAGVLLENLIILGSCVLLDRQFHVPKMSIGIVLEQVAWAAATGVFIFIGIRMAHRLWYEWFEKAPGENDEDESYPGKAFR
jgi:rod shape-determining protein MreD